VKRHVQQRATLLACAALLAACAGATQRTDTAQPEVTFEDEAEARRGPAASEGVARGEQLLAQGDARAAEAAFREAIEADERDVRAYLDLGLALEMQERLPDAERAYRSAIEIDASFAEALNNLGVLLRDRGELEEAVRTLRAAVQARPAFASAHLNLGLALEEAGETDDAMASYRRVIELAPREPTSRISLGLLLLENGERDQALIELRRAVSPAQGDRAMLSALGNGLRRAGDAEMAVRVLRDAIEAGEEEAPPPVHAELALALYAAEHHEEAERALEQLLAAHDDFAIAHYLIANMQAQRAAYADAARHYQAYLRLEPNGPQAAQARERLQRVRRPR
jgi:Tfp pilus assembly protein PilF